MLVFAKPCLWVSRLSYNPRDFFPENGNFVSFSKNRCLNCSLFATKANSLYMNTTLGNQGIDENVEILKCCEVGDLQKAMGVVLKNEKLGLDINTYCSMLQLCAEMNSLDDGRRIHSLIRSNNVKISGVIGSKLVFMYVTCGDLKEARMVFDEIENGNVFLWNFLMNEYAKVGAFEESVFLFKRMIECGFRPDSYTFSCLFKCFAALGRSKDGESIHGLLLKFNIGCSNTVMNSLIAFYFKVGRIESARMVFDKLSERDAVSWNSVISGYVGNGLPWDGIMVFNEMVRLRINTDLATMASVLAACSDMKNHLLSTSIHAYAIKVGFETNIKFENSLLDVYSKCGETHEAQFVFKNMEKRNIISFTSMILSYAREGLSDKAIALLREMIQASVPPDTYAITSMLQACAVSNSLENGKEVHNYIKETKMESDLFVCNALMDMYAKCGCMGNAESVFSHMKIKDIISWNTMIGGYSKNSLPHEALDLFIAMQKNYVKPDDITITCTLPACASLSAFFKGREIHGYVMRNSLFSDIFVSNSLIDMYIKCGALGIARLLFEKLAKKDIVSWTIMIAGYGMHGYGDEAITTFKEMIRARIKPDKVSFLSILYACSHSRLLDEGWRFFDMMRNKFNIVPELDHYACMVDLLSRGGKLPQAYKFIKKMPIEPDSTIWGNLLYGCRMYCDVEMAEKVADHVFELDPENTEYYVLLANIYAEAEKWDEIEKMKGRKIGNRGLKDNKGCSWIEVKGKVYIFGSYNNADYPEGKRVKHFLNCMSEKMEDEKEKKLSKLKYALINVDEMEKETSVCTHSERLAIGYGVLMLSRNRVIRVTKNRRICVHCHEMAKFISKDMEREIVLRDSNRFHHFKDGSCSCRGYW